MYFERLKKLWRWALVGGILGGVGVFMASCATPGGQSESATTSEQSATQQAPSGQPSGQQPASESETESAPVKFTDVHVVHFNYNMSSLRSDARKTVEEQLPFVKKFLTDMSGAKITVAGYADKRGTVAYNRALGLRRAKSVRSYLESMGISRRAIQIVSFGELAPRAKAAPGEEASVAECVFALNRRAVTYRSSKQRVSDTQRQRPVIKITSASNAKSSQEVMSTPECDGFGIRGGTMDEQ